MDYQTIIQSNAKNFKKINEVIDYARLENKRINHQIKGKELHRKWLIVFLLFIFYTLLQLVFVEYKNDYLVIITGFSLIFGVVYYAFKPVIEKQKTALYSSFTNDLAEKLDDVTHNMKEVFDVVKENELDENIIYILDETTQDKIDLIKDALELDILDRQVYTEIVKALQISDEGVGSKIAKISIHELTGMPYHTL